VPAYRVTIDTPSLNVLCKGNNMENVLVVGGLGYLGSILTDLLSRNQYNVDVCDLCLFNNGKITKDIKFKEFYSRVEDVNKDYDYVVFTCLIDYPKFYTEEYGKNFLKYQTQCLSTFTSKSKVILCTTYHRGFDVQEFKLMNDYFEHIEGQMIGSVGGALIRIPCLYGPSPRMRWDTPVNALMLGALKGEIVLDNDFATQLPIANVVDCCQFIINTIKSKERYTAVNYRTEFHSQVELAYILRYMLNPEATISVLEGTPLILNSRYDNWLGQKHLGIKESCDVLKENLEKNTNEDFANEIYNNELMLDFAFKTVGLSNILGV
jgi:hypothetical protein